MKHCDIMPTAGIFQVAPAPFSRRIRANRRDSERGVQLKDLDAHGRILVTSKGSRARAGACAVSRATFMKATDPNLLLEIQGDHIVISLPGTKFRVVYRKREHASWSWLVPSDYDRDDSKDSISRVSRIDKVRLRGGAPIKVDTLFVPAMQGPNEALRSYRAKQAEERLALGPAYDDHDLVCPRPGGSPWPPDMLSTAFGAVVRRLQVKPLRFHDLRHSHASHLLRAGIHPKIVSERLGHSTVGITLDTYSHVLPGMQEDAVGCSMPP